MSYATYVSGVACFHWRPDAEPDAPQRLNFGDEIGPILVRAMLGRAGVAADRERVPGRRLLSVGSVLHFAERGDVVWGSGVNGKALQLRPPTTLDVRAVRGPLTRAALLARGIPVPEVYGDPALLLPRLMPELRTIPRGEKTLLVPNFNEFERAEEADAGAGVELLNPIGDAEQIIRSIAGAGFVIASSLHALVVADALGIPSRPLRPTAEHAFKYLDYYAGTGRADAVFADSVEQAIELGGVDTADVDLDALEASFPWDLWGRPRPAAAGEPLPNSYAGLFARAQTQRASLLSGLPLTTDPEVGRAVLQLDRLIAADPPLDGIAREEAEILGLPLGHLADRDTRPDLGLSVVIPTHNVAPWIRETLDSVLAQEIEDMEVIVVDDHSTDATSEIVADYRDRDHRVTLVETVSRGGGTARNIGVDHARGRYLIFCDGDDIVPDGAYAALVKSLRESGSDIAFGDYLKFRSNATWRPTDLMEAYGKPQRRTTVTSEATLLYSRPCWNKLFDREWWNERDIRFPDVPRSNDIVPMTRAYLLARRVDIIPDVVYMYRDRPGGGSMSAQAVSVGSVLSYLTQERECAELVAGAHNGWLDHVYGRLVYDYDTFVHVHRFLADWTAPREGDAEVRDALRRLIRESPRVPSGAHPFRVLTVKLAARGEFALARLLGDTVEHRAHPDYGDALRQWDRLLEFLWHHDWLGSATTSRCVARVSELLLSPDAGEEPAAWGALVDRAASVLGEQALESIPETQRPGRDAELLLDARERASVRVLSFGRDDDSLVLGGRSALGQGEVLPVLFGAGGGTVHPAETSWERIDDGEWAWRAVFPVAAMPLRARLAPAALVVAEDVLVAAPGEVELPEYAAKDPLVYEHRSGVTAVTRRTHWIPRAAKRGAIIAKERAARVIRRG